MRTQLFRLFSATFLTLALSIPVATAELKLPSIIGDNMVLQRDQSVPVWGWDNPGTEVSVSISKDDAKTGIGAGTQAGKDGSWHISLPSHKAGGPYTITIKGSQTKTIKNVLFGEVWLCSGQSNMEWRVSQSNNPKVEIENAKYPQIRHIKIPHRPSDKPERDVPSTGWQETSPKTVAQFTAVGYFFGRHLHKELDVPIGLIGSNWGGTRIEPWIPPVGFKSVPALKNIADNLNDFPKKNGNRINHQTPLALYNGMISPLVPYGIRGALWYQGESNNGEGMLYHEKMKALIQGWRHIWNNKELPFYFVQLAPYSRYRGNPENLAGIWEAQLKTLSVPHTGMAVTVDISNLKDIHPKNKQDVGKRLALWALAKTYGQKDLVYSGPLYKSMKVEDNKIRVSFDHVGSGLVSRDGEPLSWFTIAGEDGKFVKAEAKIDGDTVVVWSESVNNPKAVRLGWHQDAEPNLSNKEGLPASPFRAGQSK